jgi:hypothetical protein
MEVPQMDLTLLDELFNEVPRRTSVPRQGIVTKPRTLESGLARAIGKISKRLNQLESSGIVEESPRNKLPTPLTVPIVSQSSPVIAPIVEDTKEGKKEEKIGS